MKKANKFLQTMKIAIFLVIVFCASEAQAATFNVNSTVDTLDAAPGNGICADSSNNCTLRAPISEANALAGAFVSALKVSAAPLIVCQTGSNLIVNGDAEADQAAPGDGSDIDVSGWEPETGQFTIAKYQSNYINFSDPGPANRGNFLFFGGTVASSSGTQTIDVSGCATQIDAGNLSFSLSGFLGGFSGQDDNAKLTVTFRNASGAALGTATIGPVLSADRGNSTALIARSTNGTVPVGTRTVEVVLLITRVSGTDNDGYADNLSFMLTAPTAASVSISGRAVTATGRGIGKARITLTSSNGETRTALTNAFGYYRFDGVTAGETCILEVKAKQYQFAASPRVLFVGEELLELNFTALP